MGLLDCLHRRKNKILSLEEKLESLPVITPSLVDGEVPYERTIYERALIAHGQGGRRVTEALFVFGKKERWHTKGKDSWVIATKSIDGFSKGELVVYRKQREMPFADIFSYQRLQNADQAIEYLFVGR